MIVVMKANVERELIEAVIDKVKALGYLPHPIFGVERTVIGAVGDEKERERVMEILGNMPGVERVVPILKPYKLASLEVKKEKSTIRIDGGVEVGPGKLRIIAGPCSVESEEQVVTTARAVKSAGAHALRGGAYKPRTSPYSFQGMEKEGLKLLAVARQETGLPIVTEVLNPKDVDLVEAFADVLQIGARNVQNFPLLKAVGALKKPVLLKRGMSTTIKEWLMSAEYILSQGNPHVILCERGIRTFETATRNTLDLSAIPVLREETHLPIIVDPSHATGYRNYVIPMACAAVAADCDGLMVEVHPKPDEAWSDGAQSLTPQMFAEMMAKIRKFAEIVGRSLD